MKTTKTKPNSVAVALVTGLQENASELRVRQTKALSFMSRRLPKVVSNLIKKGREPSKYKGKQAAEHTVLNHFSNDAFVFGPVSQHGLIVQPMFQSHKPHNSSDALREEHQVGCFFSIFQERPAWCTYQGAHGQPTR